MFSAPVEVDNEKKTKVYRAVSGLTTEQILCQDEDGDTSVYLLSLLSANFARNVAEIELKSGSFSGVSLAVLIECCS